MSATILFSCFPKMTRSRLHTLLRYFGTLDSAAQAEFSDFKKCGWNATLTEDFFTWKKTFNRDTMIEQLERENVQVITTDDSVYPPLLKEIYDPPAFLFVKGDLENLQHPLAIVGTRKYTPYGKQVTEKLTATLAKAGMTIVSGLALGIDTIAHETALKHGGRTIAVLGSGIDEKSIYPKSNTELSKRIIASGGAVISEYPPKTMGNRYTFPKRNRIVAGMSRGVVVIEAPLKSGSLITASSALDANREVFAVPQNITSQTAEGPNNLIKNGAHPTTSAEDILEVFDIPLPTLTAISSTTALSKEQQLLLSFLSAEPTHIDTIIQKSSYPSHTVSSTLTLLEIQGYVQNLGGMNYVLKTPL